jgi:transposase
MLGKRTAQGWLFGSDQMFRSLVGEESFYVYLADHRHELFCDDDFASLYCKDNGRPSIAPSILAVALLLQWYDNVSDEEAARRAKLDLGWKTALGLELMDVPFVKSVLCEFRNKLIVHKQQKRFFELSLRHARAQGFFKARNIHVALDTTPIFGRGAVEDTFNMLAEALRLLIHTLATAAQQTPEEYAQAHDYSRYILAKSFKGSFSSVDWDDADERQTVLDSLVVDCERGLMLAQQAIDRAEPESAGRGEIVKARSLLARLLAQDVTRTNAGAPEIIQGVAQDRIVSVHDQEMRHGRKSASQCFDGYKGALAVEVDSQIITAVDVLRGNAHDRQDAHDLITESAAMTGSAVDTVIGDGAYGTIEARLEARESTIPYTLVAPVAHAPHTGRFTKEDFQCTDDRSEVRCPAGQITGTYYERRATSATGRTMGYRRFVFHQDQCKECPLRSQCVKEKTPFRTVSFHEHETLVREARQFQRTDAFHAIYRRRIAVEHRIARPIQLGLRQARYFGTSKVLFQLAMTAALANLTLVAAQRPFGVSLWLLLAVTCILLLESRSRIKYETRSHSDSSGTILRPLRLLKTGGCQLAF